MLQKFDVFFISRETYITPCKSNSKLVDVNDETLFTYLVNASTTRLHFEYKGHFRRLRNFTSKQEMKINIPSIFVTFEKHAYIIKIEYKTIDFLYTEQLSKEKTQELVTLEGNIIYEQIQKAIQNTD